MSLTPDPKEHLARARADLRMGLGVVIHTASESVLAFSSETVSEARLAQARALGRPVVAITARRAETLKARPYDGDLARILVPADVDLSWVRSLADPANDLAMPLMGPFLADRDGDARFHRAAIRLCKTARLLPAALVVAIETGPEVAQANNLTMLDLDMLDTVQQSEIVYPEVVAARLPMEVSEAGRLHVFRPDDGGEEHYAIEIGSPDRNQPVLARVHSACFTGDLLGSLKCDCGPQLRGALARMGTEGSGVLLYLNQEGRGIGLANKMRAYSLQDQGFDTVEANHRLGFEDDERDFRIGAALLKRLGFADVRLLTNNPIKVSMLENAGIRVVERVPLKVGRSAHNADYLDTKAAKSGHLL